MEPKPEVFFMWKEFTQIEGEAEPRLVTPHSDPAIFEDPIDYEFLNVDEALAWKEEVYPKEDWHLVEVTLKPVLRHKRSE